LICLGIGAKNGDSDILAQTAIGTPPMQSQNEIGNDHSWADAGFVVQKANKANQQEHFP
jgi:hypothetical protein